MKRLTGPAIASVLLIGCSKLYLGVGCDDAMDSRRSSSGPAEEVTSSSAGLRNAETWWYWSKGVSYTFTWGIAACEVTADTFTPVE